MNTEKVTLTPTLIPLFRTVQAVGDIFSYVGENVDAATWQAIQSEARGQDFTIEAYPTGHRWHVTKIYGIAGKCTVKEEHWQQQRDHLWVTRWQAGLTEDTPATRANALAAAARLGVSL